MCVDVLEFLLLCECEPFGPLVGVVEQRLELVGVRHVPTRHQSFASKTLAHAFRDWGLGCRHTCQGLQKKRLFGAGMSVGLARPGNMPLDGSRDSIPTSAIAILSVEATGGSGLERFYGRHISYGILVMAY